MKITIDVARARATTIMLHASVKNIGAQPLRVSLKFFPSSLSHVIKNPRGVGWRFFLLLRYLLRWSRHLVIY
jgi:hypothetical protein